MQNGLGREFAPCAKDRAIAASNPNASMLKQMLAETSREAAATESGRGLEIPWLALVRPEKLILNPC